MKDYEILHTVTEGMLHAFSIRWDYWSLSTR